MKKYNYLILVSILFYILLAFVSGLCLTRLEYERGKQHRVEMNRILAAWEDPDFELSDYTYVQEVTFLPVQETDTEKIEFFYNNNNSNLDYEIRAVYEEQELTGYLRMDYKEDKTDGHALVILQISLFLLEVCVLLLLFHLKTKLVKPFSRMQKFSEELSKGNLKVELKAENTDYLGDFLWSLAQLKDYLDISKKRELELLKERKLLLLSLTHDIKTPLATIGLYNQALKQQVYESTEEVEEAHLQIEEKIAVIEAYIREIMKASHEELLDIRIEMGEFYLKDLMEKVYATYQETCMLRKIDFSIEKYDDRILRGDIHRALEVFGNIIENAIKYGDGRKIEIRFSLEEGCQLIHIFNSGEVVSENDFSHLFESFYRGGNVHGRNGNGLGLYICREIMHKMGGEIYARTEEDGMTFVLVFA